MLTLVKNLNGIKMKEMIKIKLAEGIKLDFLCCQCFEMHPPILFLSPWVFSFLHVIVLEYFCLGVTQEAQERRVCSLAVWASPHHKRLKAMTYVLFGLEPWLRCLMDLSSTVWPTAIVPCQAGPELSPSNWALFLWLMNVSHLAPCLAHSSPQ